MKFIGDLDKPIAHPRGGVGLIDKRKRVDDQIIGGDKIGT
jgi:hypothetical protein